MDICEKIKETAVQSGMWQADFINTKGLLFYPEIREICKGNTCRNYGATWACPPAVGTIEECKKRVMQYEKMLLFSIKYDLEDFSDIEGMSNAMLSFKASVDVFDEKLRMFLSGYLLLSNEGCGRCAKCTYPDFPCRFPEYLHHSIEGYGFNIHELAKAAGIKYNNGENTVTFFGGLLFERQAQKIQMRELRNRLIEAITADEWNRLKHADPSLTISSFNREVLLSVGNTPVGDSEIDTDSVRDLHRALQQYLDTYMADCPTGHKWIIITSIYLTFVQKRPMHPQQATHWRRVAGSKKTEYICPCKDTAANSVCSYCVCNSDTNGYVLFNGNQQIQPIS